MNKFLLLVFGCFCCAAGLLAQNASDIVVPVTVTTTNSPASITLSFPATANATNTLIGRKLINSLTWEFFQLAPNATTFTDSGVLPGFGFEYMVVKQTTTAPTQRIGLVYAGIEVPAIAYRGKIILVVDDALSSPLSMELDRLVHDLRGDGWQVIRRDIDVAAHTVPTVKSLIRKIYEDDPGSTVGAFLFGNIPVPYSGNINPDGHPDHLGAWPTDYYYGDMNEAAWTDNLVNSTSASRPANRNIPGDGKFDQSEIPTLAEIVVSRVDFSNLSGWDVSQTELYRRYLNKNHNFRTGAYKPDNKTIVDDNFGYFGGEAFAQNGWRNGNAITGVGSITQGDFFNDTDNQSFLIGYGCGGGNYTGASGVGSSTNFQTDSVNIVFSMLFGSYFGDWDFETNPFMPSALASKGGILICSWAGRPNWHLHTMGLGEPILTSTYWVRRNSFLQNPVYPPNFGGKLIHAGLLGDLTLRAHAVQPPENAVAVASCDGVNLTWKTSPDASLGYLVYRAPSPDSIFELIINAPVTTSSYLDTMPLPGMNFYQVKSFKLEMVPTGSYYNQSIGAPASVDFNTDPLSASATASSINCNGGNDGAIDLSVSGGLMGNFTYLWSNNSTTQNLSGLSAGTYTVTITDESGCTYTLSAQVTEPPVITVILQIEHADCTNGYRGSINRGGGSPPPLVYLWSNGVTTLANENIPAGTYTMTITDANGCTKLFEAVVELIPFSPQLPPISGNDTSCINVPQTYSLPATFALYQWSASDSGAILQGQGTAQVEAFWPNTGLHTLTLVVTNDQDCQDTTQLMVYTDICLGADAPVLPGVTIQPNPFNEQLTVRFDRPIQAGAQLRLLDLQGRLILENTALTESTRLETGHLPAGSYVLQIVENGRVGVWKVVKME